MVGSQTYKKYCKRGLFIAENSENSDCTQPRGKTTEEVGFSSTLTVGNPVFHVGTVPGIKENFCCRLYSTKADIHLELHYFTGKQADFLQF